MEDRIKINGEWYVKESKAKEDFKFTARDILKSREMLIETDDFSLTASVLEDQDEKFLIPSIDYNVIGGEVEYWDNNDFLLGVANRESDHIEQLDDYSDEVKHCTIILCDEMKKLGWI